MTIFNIISTTITAAACVYAAFAKPLNGVLRRGSFVARSERLIAESADKYHYALLALIITAGAFVRFYKLAEIPAGLYIDEAGAAYDGLSLLNYGVDRTLARYPVYLANFGGGQSIIAAYLMALSYKLFGGYSLLATRVPNALIGVSLILSSYFLLKALRGRGSGLAAAFVAAICPLFIQTYRFGLDCTPMLPFMTAAMAWLFWGIKTNRTSYFAAAGITFGLTLYTYVAAYIVLPLLLVISIPLLLLYKKATLKQILALGIPLFILALPLILFVAVNYGIIQPIETRLMTIPRLPSWRASEIGGLYTMSNIRNFKFLLLCDDLPYLAFKPYYTMYLMSLPLLALGFFAAVRDTVKSIKNKTFDLIFLIDAAFVASMIKYLFFGAVTVNREIDIYMCFIVFIALGIREIWLRLPLAAPLVIALYGVCLTFFSTYYFTKYSEDRNPLVVFQRNAIEAIQYARQVAPGDYLYFTSYWFGISQYTGYVFPLLADGESPYVYQQTKYTTPDEVYCYSGANCYLPVHAKEDGSIVWEIYPDCVYALCEDYATETTYAVFDKLEEEGFTLYDGLPPYRVYYYDEGSPEALAAEARKATEAALTETEGGETEQAVDTVA